MARFLAGFSETSVPVPPVGDSCRMFTAAPAGEPTWPAVLILRSAYEIDDHLETVALDFVGRGYLAAVPDLYCNDADYANHKREHIEAAAHLRADPKSGSDVLSAVKPSERERIAAAGAWLARRTSQLFPFYVKACFEALRKDPKNVYDASHGFSLSDQLQCHDATAARQSMTRAQAFLARHRK